MPTTAPPLQPPEAPFGGLAPTVTLEDVELCRVGQWNASTGGIEITPAVLAGLAEASRDPDADHVPIHAGHVDPRFPALSDGEPAMGWVQNVRVIGDRLVGDLANVPARLAAIIPKAYRRRSIEIAANVARPGGLVRPYALHGLGLLGVEMPAVKGLADVAARYSTSPATEGMTLLLSDESHPTPPKESPVPPNPQHPGQPRIPDERLRELMGLAADADVSRLQSELTSTYEAGDPAAAAPLPVPAPATAPADPASAAAEPAGASVPGANVPTARELVNASAAPTTGFPASLGAAAAVSPTDGRVTLSAAQWEGIQGLIRDQAEQRVETVLAAALSSGRIAPAETAGWREHLVADEARTGALLNLLPAGRVPVTELGSVGHANLSAHSAAGEEQMLAFEASLGLELPNRSAASAAQTQGA